eukprot:1176832-Prorocentrum_minimum.AAC.3
MSLLPSSAQDEDPVVGVQVTPEATGTLFALGLRIYKLILRCTIVPLRFMLEEHPLGSGVAVTSAEGHQLSIQRYHTGVGSVQLSREDVYLQGIGDVDTS